MGKREGLEHRGDVYLLMWGRWARNRRDFGIGDASITMEGRLIRDGGLLIAGTKRTEDENPDAERVERAVLSLDERTREYVKSHYVKRRTTVEIAQECRVGRDTVAKELDKARMYVLAKME